MIKVDQAQRDESTGKEAGGEKVKAESVLPIQDQTYCRREPFHQKIGKGNSLPAMPASAPEEEVGDNGNIVVEFNSIFAGRAGRRRMEEAHAPGNTVNHHVEEASPSEPKKREDDYLFQGMTAVLTFPVLGS
jgi:hypothetical protein